MLEILKFVLSGFWPFVGTVILLYVAMQGFATVLGAFVAVLRSSQPDHAEPLKRLAESIGALGDKFKTVPPGDVITFAAKGSDDGLKM